MTAESIDRIRVALGFIPAHDRETWVRAGMGIKSELGDSGFDLWDEWSRTAESYNPKAARDVWRSIKVIGKVNIGSLFHQAKANGWRDDGTRGGPAIEEMARRKQYASDRARREHEEIARERATAAARADALCNAGVEAKPDHAYLVLKKVSPVPTLREISASDAAVILGYAPRSSGQLLTGRLLLAPVTVDGMLSTVEMIDCRGRKAALAGRGTKTGGYWATSALPAGDGEGSTLLIGEGVATVLSSHLSCQHPGLAVLSNSNIVPVAKAIRERYPAADLVVLADLVKGSCRPDLHAAEAAQVVRGRLAIPNFGTDCPATAKDFNDMMQLMGADAVARTIDGAREQAQDKPRVLAAKPAGGGRGVVELIRASDIEPEAVDWLWPEYIAVGKLTVLAGAPGTGKTTLAMRIAATATTGGRWPDGSRCSPGDVVIWSGEDDPKDTLVPRLGVAGADLTRAHFVATVLDEGARRPFDPAGDMQALRSELERIGSVRLLIVDPIVSAVAGDSHKNAEVRRALQPLVDLASEMRCSLLGITHFTKGTSGREPVERLTGSLAFGALARVVLVAVKRTEEEDDGRTVRLLLRAKSNVGPDGGGFEYELHRAEMTTHPGIVASAVKWGKAVEGAARELLTAAESASNDDTRGALDKAKDFLSTRLSDGPVEQSIIKAEATNAGHSWPTVRRAQKALGIRPRKLGMIGGWFWELPRRCSSDPERAQQKVMSTFEDIEHLRNHVSMVEVEI